MFVERADIKYSVSTMRERSHSLDRSGYGLLLHERGGMQRGTGEGGDAVVRTAAGQRRLKRPMSIHLDEANASQWNELETN